MEDIIKLVDISLENGRLEESDYQIILAKAKSVGISEAELNLIISKRAKNSEGNQTESKSDQKSRSYFPYGIAMLAIIFTFFDWVGAYSRASMMGSSGSWDLSFSGWWGGYAAAAVLIYGVGCYLYFKGNRLYWLAGLLAIADAFYIYSAITSADVSYSYNYGGYGASGEAGYELLWGFWGFVIVSGLFALSALSVGKRSSANKRIANRFEQNFKSGWKVLAISAVISVVIYTLIFIGDEPFNMALIFAFFIVLVLSLITLFLYIFTSSSRAAGYGILGLGFLLFIGMYLFIGEGPDFLELFFFLMIYPACYVILERFIPSKNNLLNTASGIVILFLVATMNFGCSDQPRGEFRMDNSNSINGTYISESGGVESSLTIMGDTWFGTHTETSFGNLLSSGSGIVDGNKIFDQYGRELGYISNGAAHVNLGGFQVTLQKK